MGGSRRVAVHKPTTMNCFVCVRCRDVTLYTYSHQGCKKLACKSLGGEKSMKLVQFVVAAAMLVPAVSSFAQSTPSAVNSDVRAQLVEEGTTTYHYSRSSDRTQDSINDAKRNALLPHQITGMSMGRYSLSIVRPSF
jgi:hypothetical protein